MADPRYVPYTFGMSAKIASEDDELTSVLDELVREAGRMATLTLELDMGMPINNEDGRRLLAALRQAQAKLAEKPPPTMLTTVRRWLAAKIAPSDSEEWD